jgi:hypothetical protein
VRAWFRRDGAAEKQALRQSGRGKTKCGQGRIGPGGSGMLDEKKRFVVDHEAEVAANAAAMLNIF